MKRLAALALGAALTLTPGCVSEPHYRVVKLEGNAHISYRDGNLNVIPITDGTEQAGYGTSREENTESESD